MRRRMVIGLGNAGRGDDAAGLACVAALRGRLPEEIELIETDGEPAVLLKLLAQASEACLIDASVSGALPGTVARFDVAGHPLPALAAPASTHGLGLSEALELARALGVLPGRCVVYAIEGLDYEPGAPLTEPVLAAISAVAERIVHASVP